MLEDSLDIATLFFSGIEIGYGRLCQSCLSCDVTNYWDV